MATGLLLHVRCFLQVDDVIMSTPLISKPQVGITRASLKHIDNAVHADYLSHSHQIYIAPYHSGLQSDPSGYSSLHQPPSSSTPSRNL